jgi:hypothetical protein
MRAALCSAAVLLLSCAEPSQRLLGVYEYGFEHNRFHEEGRGYRADWGWCIDQESWELLDLPAVPEHMTNGSVEIEFEGQISPHGHYGHMGLCEREIHITRLIRKSDVRFECYYDRAHCERLMRGATG